MSWKSRDESEPPPNVQAVSEEFGAAGVLDAPSEEFSRRYERCFRRVYRYASRRVSDWRSVDEIVACVLAENLDLLSVEHGVTAELTALKRSTDRELARRKTTPHRAAGNGENHPGQQRRTE